MTNNQQPLNFMFVTCPKCNGYGVVLNLNKSLSDCPHCQKKESIYGLVDQQVLYWHKIINKQVIRQEKIQKAIKKIINIFCIIVSICGILALAYVIFLNVNINPDLFSILFAKNHYILFFWLSIFFDMFIYYRLILESDKKIKMLVRQFGKDLEEIKYNYDWNSLAKLNKQKINIAKFYNQEAIDAITQAYLVAEQYKHSQVDTIDLLSSISETKNIHYALLRLGINIEAYQEKIKRIIQKQLPENPDFKKVVILAYFEAYNSRRVEISVLELLIALFKIDDLIKDIFDDFSITEEKLTNVIEWIHLEKKLHDWSRSYRGKAKNKPKSHMNKAMTARPTKLLDHVSQDYTLKAKMGHFFPLIGREKEVAEAFRILKEGKGNIILLGDAGVGKTTIIEGIAQLMTAEDVPAKLQDKRLVVLDPGVLIAGAGGVGGVEERVVKVIYEIILAGNVILVIEDIHNLLGARSTGSGSDAGEILMNFLSQGYLQVIGTSTKTEYQKFIANKETFLRRFQPVRINEMPVNDTIKLLEAKSAIIENRHHVFFSYDAIDNCVKLTDRYIKDRYLPAKALDVQEEAAVYCREKKGENTIVTKEDVATVISEKTNVEVASITASEADKLLHLEEVMHQRIVGQDEAITAIARSLRRAREELRDINRPIASFLFLGPTGVGKTETAKTIADVYFGNEKNMIRLDMSEFQEQHSVSRLIGDQYTAGYLTDAARQKPFSLILLDELEKAHPDVLNIFLQVMDDGRLTDGKGKTIDFTNTIIIATSNAATDVIQTGTQQGLNSMEIYEGLMNGYLQKYFRPEFINRFDRVVVFAPLRLEEVYEIARLLLMKLAATLLNKGITFQVTNEAVQELAAKGYSPQFGARPLKRLLQDTVDDALAKLMLEKKINRRDTIILLPGGEIQINKASSL